MTRTKPQNLPDVTFDENEEGILPGGLFNLQGGSPLNQNANQRSIVEISVQLIDPSPYQKRKIFDDQGLIDFADIMRQKGFTSVIWVRPNPDVFGRYELLYGERRWRAAKIVASDPNPKFTTIPCEIRTDINDPLEILELGLIENGQRVDLAPSEEAQSFEDMLKLRKEDGTRIYTLDILSAKLKKNVSYIQDRLHLLELPTDVRAAYDRNDKIALRALREVTRIPKPEDRAPILDLLVQGEFSVRAVREVLAEMAVEEQGEQNQSKIVSSHDNALSTLPDEELLESDTQNKAGGEESRVTVSDHPENDQEESTLDSPSTASGSTGLSSSSSRPSSALTTYKGVISRDKKNIRVILERWEKISREQGDDVRAIIQDALDELGELSVKLRLPTVK